MTLFANNRPSSEFMPICQKNKFIFLHIPRCGGTSIERVFNLRSKQQLFGVVRMGDQERTLHHLTPGDLEELGLVDPSVLESYFKCTIIRDPFSRMASDYLWQQRYDRHNLFKSMQFSDYLDFAESVVKNQRYFEKVHFDHFRPMVSYCLNGGELVVDDILLLENIDIELKRIQPLIGVVDLPRINASPSYQHLSTRENIDRVRILYEEDWLLYERIQALHHSLYR